MAAWQSEGSRPLSDLQFLWDGPFRGSLHILVLQQALLSFHQRPHAPLPSTQGQPSEAGHPQGWKNAANLQPLVLSLLHWGQRTGKGFARKRLWREPSSGTTRTSGEMLAAAMKPRDTSSTTRNR